MCPLPPPPFRARSRNPHSSDSAHYSHTDDQLKQVRAVCTNYHTQKGLVPAPTPPALPNVPLWGDQRQPKVPCPTSNLLVDTSNVRAHFIGHRQVSPILNPQAWPLLHSPHWSGGFHMRILRLNVVFYIHSIFSSPLMETVVLETIQGDSLSRENMEAYIDILRNFGALKR